ncbi:TetR/AcrR family transcriptional regulator [Xanthobacter sediminis]
MDQSAAPAQSPDQGPYPAPHPAEAPHPAPDRRAEQRRRILSAAMACFAREGFHATSMQKICAEAGMSPGAFYRYFRSKEELIAAIVADERSERQHMLDAVARAPSVLDALADCLQVMLEEDTLPTARLGPEIMAEAIRNTHLRAAIEPCEEEARAVMRQALGAAAARGEIDSTLDLEDVMVMLQAMADGLILHHQLHPAWGLSRRIPSLAALVRRMLAPARKG